MFLASLLAHLLDTTPSHSWLLDLDSFFSGDLSWVTFPERVCGWHSFSVFLSLKIFAFTFESSFSEVENSRLAVLLLQVLESHVLSSQHLCCKKRHNWVDSSKFLYGNKQDFSFQSLEFRNITRPFLAVCSPLVVFPGTNRVRSFSFYWFRQTGEWWCPFSKAGTVKREQCGWQVHESHGSFRYCDGGLVGRFSQKQEHLDQGFLNYLWWKALYFNKTHTTCGAPGWHSD